MCGIIEEGDITFWVEKLAVDSIKRNYAQITKKRVLFDPDQFRFQVEYDAFETDLYFQCYLKTGPDTEEMLIEAATGFVALWNETSEKEGTGKGVVHNVGISRHKPGFVEISMNLGSALAPFLKWKIGQRTRASPLPIGKIFAMNWKWSLSTNMNCRATKAQAPW